MIKTTQDTVYNAVNQEKSIIYSKIVSIDTNYLYKTISIVINDYILEDVEGQTDKKEVSIRFMSRNFTFAEYSDMLQLIKSQVPQFEHLADTKERELELATYGHLHINNQEKPYGATREIAPVVLPVS